MATALARLIQVIGWVWVIAGFLLPVFGLARPNLFPGFILIFVARALRTQAARRAPREEDVEGPFDSQTVLTSRQDRPKPAPTPERTTPSPPPKSPRETTQAPPVEPVVVEQAVDRDDIIERIAVAGRAASEVTPEREKPTATSPAVGEERKAPMTSAEMIAQARKRWDSKS